MNKTDPTTHKVSRGRLKKEGIVARLLEKKEKAKAMIFTNYQGLTHKQIEELKKGIKASDAEFVVAKNTLLQKAMGDIKEIESLEGPTGTIFAYSDVIAPLKEVAKAIKRFALPTISEAFKVSFIKFGILDGKSVTSQDLLKIASLPSREVLIAQLIAGLKSPIFGLHRALNWNLQKLVMTLSEVQKKKATGTETKLSSPAQTGVADEQSEEVTKNG